MVDASTDAVETLIAPIRDHLEWMEKENARLAYIKATIRVNAMRRGATKEQIDAFLSGEASFIDWLSDVVSGPQSALAAERDALSWQLHNLQKDMQRVEWERDALQREVDAYEEIKADIAARGGPNVLRLQMQARRDRIRADKAEAEALEAVKWVLESIAVSVETHGVYPELNIWNGGPEWLRHAKEIAANIRALDPTQFVKGQDT